MSEQALRFAAFLEQETSRLLFEGAAPIDLHEVLAATAQEQDWIRGWRERAGSERAAALEALDQGCRTTARERLVRAAYYFRLGHYFLMEDSEERKELVRAAEDSYLRAADLADPLIEPITVPYGERQHFATGYLHLPARDANEPCPCVVMLPGLGHTKIGMHGWARAGTARGFAVFCGDGPGYGDARTLRGDRLAIADFGAYLDALHALLAAHPALAAERLVLFGDCFGALLALTELARTDHWSACVLVQGILDDPQLRFAQERVPSLVHYHLAPADLDRFVEAGRYYAQILPRIRRPVCLIHAETDGLVPLEAVQWVYGKLAGPKRLIVVPGEPRFRDLLKKHYNRVQDELVRLVPDAFDWLTGVLRATPLI